MAEEKTNGGWATDGFCGIYIWALNSQTLNSKLQGAKKKSYMLTSNGKGNRS